MAHGERAKRHFGREYWSKRLPGAIPWGRVGKWLTHRRERREARRLERMAKATEPTPALREDNEFYKANYRGDEK